MTPRTLATVAAITSLIFGTVGLVLPQVIGTAFGMTFDPTATALVRLASSSYLGYAVLCWLARGLVDPAAWRAVAGANFVSWVLGAAVLSAGITSGLGDSRGWAFVAMQAGFSLAWALTYVRAPTSSPSHGRSGEGSETMR